MHPEKSHWRSPGDFFLAHALMREERVMRVLNLVAGEGLGDY